MSVHYEWLDAGLTGVCFLPAGHDVTTGAPADEDTTDDRHVDYGGALLLSVDECVVLQGSPDELRTLLNRALAALPDEGKS